MTVLYPRRLATYLHSSFNKANEDIFVVPFILSVENLEPILEIAKVAGQGRILDADGWVVSHVDGATFDGNDHISTVGGGGVVVGRGGHGGTVNVIVGYVLIANTCIVLAWFLPADLDCVMRAKPIL